MKKISFIFIILVAALALFTSGCSLKQKATPTTTNTSAAIPPFLSQTNDTVQTRTSNNLAIAKAKAAEWKNDAVLTAYNVKVPADLTSIDPEETFIFGSTQDTFNWWTISISADGSFIRALIPRQDYLGNELQPITQTAWQKTYLEALNTAEANGGLTFRAQNPEAQISLILEQAQPNNFLWWVVTYQGANNSLKVRISARDGGIYDDFGSPISGISDPTSSPLPATSPAF